MRGTYPLTLALLITLFCMAPTISKAESISPNLSEERSAKSIDEGILILDGQYIAPPYKITHTREGVFVNELSFPVLLEKEIVDDENTLRPTRRRGPGARRRLEVNNTSANGRNKKSENTPLIVSQVLAHALSDNAIVIAFADVPMAQADPGDEELELCKVILSDHRDANQLDWIVDMVGTEDARNWIASFVPDAPLRKNLNSRVEAAETRISKEFAHIAAVSRLDELAYPMTLVAMLLGIYGLGHTLRWAGDGIGEQSRTGGSKRQTTIALSLMLAMSLIDLMWTILASDAGTMKEVNPLANSMIQSPAQLIAFKLALSCGALGILFFYRGRSFVQQTTWWMCLVCVLVTFRWVVFDSMMQ